MSKFFEIIGMFAFSIWLILFLMIAGWQVWKAWRERTPSTPPNARELTNTGGRNDLSHWVVQEGGIKPIGLARENSSETKSP
jgi:hypothetical protein